MNHWLRLNRLPAIMAADYLVKPTPSVECKSIVRGRSESTLEVSILGFQHPV
jgi:hypothetical protein